MESCLGFLTLCLFLFHSRITLFLPNFNRCAIIRGIFYSPSIIWASPPWGRPKPSYASHKKRPNSKPPSMNRLPGLVQSSGATGGIISRSLQFTHHTVLNTDRIIVRPAVALSTSCSYLYYHWRQFWFNCVLSPMQHPLSLYEHRTP